MIGCSYRQSLCNYFHSNTGKRFLGGSKRCRVKFDVDGVMSDVEEDDFVNGESDGEETVKDDGGHKEEDEEEATSEHEEQVEASPLTQEIIQQGLSLLCRTGNGLSHAFVKLDLKDRRLTDLALLSSFVHLRFLDISSNHMADLSPLSALTQLLWLKGDGNLVRSFTDQPLGQLPYLQWLSLALNRISDLEGLGGAALETLNLIGNSIQRVSGLEYNRLTNLVTLELRGNRLESTDGIYLPNLRNLYLAQNGIKRLEGLDRLEHLTTLHLRDNHLDTLDGIGPNMKALQYLNIRGNQVSSPRALLSLGGVASTLRVLVLAENPLADSEDYRLFVLTRLLMLERLDKEQISPDERAEARERLGEFENEDDPGQDEM